jgi:hypothetical protein
LHKKYLFLIYSNALQVSIKMVKWRSFGENTMRLYSFVNANYLKDIQHGLQTAHAVAELYNKYPEETAAGNCARYDVLNDWSRNHKTIIILDGGDCQDLWDIFRFLLDNDETLKLPFVKFAEDTRSLNNALTAVAIVVPAEIYEVKKDQNPQGTTFFDQSTNQMLEPTGYTLVKDGKDGPHSWRTPALEQFYLLLKSKPLAR